jgi:hypothetical protein
MAAAGSPNGISSDFAIHPMAGIFGEPDALLSMTALRAAAVGGREAIIDKSHLLAMFAAKRCMAVSR